MAIKVLVLGLAVVGAVQLWVAVCADVLGLVLVTANGMRLLAFDWERAKAGDGAGWGAGWWVGAAAREPRYRPLGGTEDTPPAGTADHHGDVVIDIGLAPSTSLLSTSRPQVEMYGAVK